MSKKSRTQFLEKAKAVAHDKPVELSVRDLLALWGFQRRSYPRVQRIDEELAGHGLRVDPALYEAGWIENRVGLVPLAGTEGQATLKSQEIGLRVSQIESAQSGVESVKRESTLAEAQTLMMLNDYSQLAVWNGRGSEVMVVSWESVAKAQLCKSEATLADAIVPARSVGLEDDLVPLIATIANEDFVFVRSKNRELSGIITSADLSIAFETLAGPFFLLGEIERRLRRVVEQAFTADEIQAMRDPSDNGPAVQSVDDLSFGEMVRQLETPDHFERTGWPVDRALVIKRLNRIREIRNDLMHFSPDPPDDTDRELMRTFLTMLRALSR
jgi:predicted transcriptional regulator